MNTKNGHASSFSSLSTRNINIYDQLVNITPQWDSIMKKRFLEKRDYTVYIYISVRYLT